MSFGGSLGAIGQSLHDEIVRNSLMAHQQKVEAGEKAKQLIATGDPTLMKAGFMMLMEPEKHDWLGKLKEHKDWTGETGQRIDQLLGQMNLPGHGQPQTQGLGGPKPPGVDAPGAPSTAPTPGSISGGMGWNNPYASSQPKGPTPPPPPSMTPPPPGMQPPGSAAMAPNSLTGQ